MRAVKGFVRRQIADEVVLVPVEKMSKDMPGLIVLSESGAFLWDVLQQDSDEEALVQALLREYILDEETARADVREYLDNMLKLGLIDCSAE